MAAKVKCGLLIMLVLYSSSQAATFRVEMLLMRLGIFLCLLLPIIATAQKDSNHFYFDEVDLHFYKKNHFRIVSAAEDAAAQKKGEAAIKQSTGQTVDGSNTKTLLSLKTNETNYLTINVTPLALYEGDYDSGNKALETAAYQVFKERVGAEKIDTSSGTHVIDGLQFRKFVMKINLQPVFDLYMVMFSRAYGKYDLAFMYVTTDTMAKKEMEAMINGSRFEPTKIDVGTQPAPIPKKKS